VSVGTGVALGPPGVWVGGGVVARRDPAEAVLKLAGRPMFIVHGLADTTIRPHNAIDLSVAALRGGMLWYLVRRPQISAATRLWLLVGVGLLPIGAALTGNLAGFEVTKQRTFCGSCHTMTSRVRDAGDPSSQSLAAKHSRNAAFGGESCYTCHEDYGMFGAITT
jgi:hypothetical protein